MIGALLIFAVLCGCAGAWRGNRTSWALLGSAALSCAFIRLGVPFVWPVWMTIDLAVVGMVACRPMKVSDCLVLALFVGVWPLYPSVERGDLQASNLVNLIVSLQFLLSAPWRWVLHKCRIRRVDLEAEGEFLRVLHA